MRKAAAGAEHVTEEMVRDSKVNHWTLPLDLAANLDVVFPLKELLKLFGIPFIESPAEAEAQCAVLHDIGLVRFAVILVLF